MSGPGSEGARADAVASQPRPIPIQLGRLLLEWGQRTYLMGVLNVTPDSFSGDGVMGIEAACSKARELLAEGADILDVGGESTRPGAEPVPLEEELRRVIPVIHRLVNELDAPISVDTKKAEVARQALRVGAAMINDVSALQADPLMAAVVASAGVPVVLMHGYGKPQTDPQAPDEDIVAIVRVFLDERIEVATGAGISRDFILIDPGFGFGKSIQQNLEILRRLEEFRALGRPIMIGTSRKGTIGQVLGGLPVQDRLEGTAATIAIAIANGADIVRMHDVRVMARVARMTDAIVRGT